MSPVANYLEMKEKKRKVLDLMLEDKWRDILDIYEVTLSFRIFLTHNIAHIVSSKQILFTDKNKYILTESSKRLYWQPNYLFTFVYLFSVLKGVPLWECTKVLWVFFLEFKTPLWNFNFDWIPETDFLLAGCVSTTFYSHFIYRLYYEKVNIIHRK